MWVGGYVQNVLLLFVFFSSKVNLASGQTLVCPAVRTTSGWLDLFPLPCRKNVDCAPMGVGHLCCKGFCTRGARAAPLQRSVDQPTKSSVVASSSSSSTTASTTQPTTSITPRTTTSSTTTPSTTTSTTTTPKPTTTTPKPTTTTPKPTTTTPKPTTTSTTSTTTTTTTPSTTSSTTTTTTTTTTTPKPTTTTTEPPPRPFLQILPIQNALVEAFATAATTQRTPAPAKAGKLTSQKLVCPKPNQSPVILFPIPCEKNSQCRTSSGPDQVCCQGRCVRGVPAPRPPKPKISHQPLLGVIPRECPAAPLGELLFEVQSCKSDADCWPRVCCPDGKRSYCMTARARLDLVPVANRIDAPVRMLEQYLQCTPAPQYDLFPQRCSSSVDCFPNLCCAEGGKKHCRPPQRSLLALLAGVSQRIG